MLSGTLVLFGCGFRLDMQVQPKVKPLRQSDFFEDGRASRPLIPGTVARGEAREDTYYYTGMVAPGKPGDELPFPATKAALERGEQRFNIYCSPCHSRVGDGNGIVVQRGYRRPPSFHDPKLLNAPLGTLLRCDDQRIRSYAGLCRASDADRSLEYRGVYPRIAIEPALHAGQCSRGTADSSRDQSGFRQSGKWRDPAGR